METEILKPRKANKGEWSEIYTFFKLLVDKSVNGADENLNAVPDKVFTVLKIIRGEKEKGGIKEKTYDLSREKEKAFVMEAKESSLKAVDLNELRNGVKRIFESIRDGKGRSFAVPEAEVFMREFLCSSIKASSSDKTDIRLVMQDRFSPKETESGFSIKTAYQAAPTLLNASKKNTSFLYEVVRNAPVTVAPEVKRVRDRVTAIYESGGLNFVKVESDVFKKNLELIDLSFPRILAVMLANYHRGKASTVADLVKLLPQDPNLSDIGQSEEFYKIKVKHFLEAIALGMTPAKKWDGSSQANGGFIVVKDDGELACYHLYDREKFLEYLYNHTKFDTPSTTRHEYGTPVQTDGKEHLSLNIQIRFI